MKKSNLVKPFTLAFFLISALDSLGLVLNESMLRLAFKPLIIPSLALLYWVSVKQTNKIYLLALFFAFLGDTLLLKRTQTFFLFGLSSFLLTHIAYIAIVTKDITSYKLKPILIAAFPFVFTFVSLILVIKENVGSLFIPILVYGTIITLLGTLSFYNYLEKRSRSSLLMLLGAFLFIVSDGVLAIERFMVPHRELELGLTVMFTYILAQYLIYKYMVKRSEFN